MYNVVHLAGDVRRLWVLEHLSAFKFENILQKYL